MLTGVLVLAMLLAGCAPVAREPDRLGLVQVLGVDGDGTLTAVCAKKGEEEPVRGEVTADTFEAGVDQLPYAAEQELSLTSVAHLVVGEGVELRDTLLYIMKDEELGATLTIWQTPQGAGALLEGCPDPEGALALLEGRGIHPPTAAEALAALTTWGWVSLPLLELEGEELVYGGMEPWEE